MSSPYCPECGHQHPTDARFCMYCGYLLTNDPATPVPGAPGTVERPAPAQAPQDRGPDWRAIAAAFLAFLTLQHMSRKARQTAVIITILMLFFGCPMVCGFMAFVMEWFGRLFQ